MKSKETYYVTAPKISSMTCTCKLNRGFNKETLFDKAFVADDLESDLGPAVAREFPLKGIQISKRSSPLDTKAEAEMNIKTKGKSMYKKSKAQRMFAPSMVQLVMIFEGISYVAKNRLHDNGTVLIYANSNGHLRRTERFICEFLRCTFDQEFYMKSSTVSAYITHCVIKKKLDNTSPKVILEALQQMLDQSGIDCRVQQTEKSKNILGKYISIKAPINVVPSIGNKKPPSIVSFKITNRGKCNITGKSYEYVKEFAEKLQLIINDHSSKLFF
jgi:hypothetical protein